MIKLQFGLEFYEEPVIDEETGQTAYVMKSRPAIYTADKAVKGPNYMHLLDENDTVIASFEGISDFAGYELLEGEWSDPIVDVDNDDLSLVVNAILGL